MMSLKMTSAEGSTNQMSPSMMLRMKHVLCSRMMSRIMCVHANWPNWYRYFFFCARRTDRDPRVSSAALQRALRLARTRLERQDEDDEADAVQAVADHLVVAHRVAWAPATEHKRRVSAVSSVVAGAQAAWQQRMPTPQPQRCSLAQSALGAAQWAARKRHR